MHVSTMEGVFNTKIFAERFTCFDRAPSFIRFVGFHCCYGDEDYIYSGATVIALSSLYRTRTVSCQCFMFVTILAK